MVKHLGKEDRIPIFDALKGIAILLMIINHVNLEGAWSGKLIGVFHMPLFFLISGYLFKPRSIKDTIQRNLHKILLPYFSTCFIIWAIMSLRGNTNWGWSILWGNSKPFADNYSVGPLWFLTAFFVTMIYANIVMKISNKSIRWLIVSIFFSISDLLVRKTGMLLPFGITTAWGGVIFLIAGMEVKNSPKLFQNKQIVVLGIAIWFICIIFGYCAMAWHVYKLNLLQVIAGVYGSYICYKIILQLNSTSFLYRIICYIGKNSLLIMCIHSAILS